MSSRRPVRRVGRRPLSWDEAIFNFAGHLGAESARNVARATGVLLLLRVHLPGVEPTELRPRHLRLLPLELARSARQPIHDFLHFVRSQP
jgi:hypothetical protein